MIIDGPAAVRGGVRSWETVISAMAALPEKGELEITIPGSEDKGKFKGSFRSLIQMRKQVNTHRWTVTDGSKPDRLLVIRGERYPSLAEELASHGRMVSVNQEVQEHTVERTTVTTTTAREVVEPNGFVVVKEEPLPVAVKELPAPEPRVEQSLVIKLPESDKPPILHIPTVSQLEKRLMDVVIRFFGPEGEIEGDGDDWTAEMERLAAIGYAQRWAEKESNRIVDQVELEEGLIDPVPRVRLRFLMEQQLTRQRLLELELLEYCKKLSRSKDEAWKLPQVRTLLNPEDDKRLEVWVGAKK